MTTTLSARDLVQAADDLFPVLDAAWAASDRDRHLPDGVAEHMRAAGLFRVLVPAELDGPASDLRTYVEVLERTAYGLGAAGWNLATSTVETLYATGLRRPAVDAIYGAGPDVILAGTVTLDRDAATAVATPEGYRVAGSWRFGSGSYHADYMIGSAQVYHGETPRLLPDGSPEWRYFAVPRAEARLHDNWQTMGLRGTGSNDWSLADCLVPEEMTELANIVQTMVPPRPWQGALYRVPLNVVNAVHFAAVATGIARRAIDALVELASVKKPHRASGLLRERIQAQEAVARAEVILESSRAYRDRVIDDAWHTIEAGDVLSRRQRAAMRASGVNCSESAVRAVDLMYTAGGTTSFEDESPLSRCLRDVRVVSQGIGLQALHYESVGRVLFGMEPGGMQPI
jgi:alkylation response protein AidB-like acyl-CoA dehydrogenase